MTLLEGLQSHTGGLLRIKSELYWYGGRVWDETPGRICLVLDAADHAGVLVAATRGESARASAAVLLLIDGCPRWVWVSQEDVELIT